MLILFLMALYGLIGEVSNPGAICQESQVPSR